MNMIRVLIVDDHPLFREGVAELLSRGPNIEIVECGATAEEAIRLSAQYSPDVLLLDVGIPGGGLSAVEAVSAKCPATKIVMLTASETNLVAAFKAGASAYVLKGVSAKELRPIIEGVMAGESYVAPSLAAALLREMAQMGRTPVLDPNPINSLTERERQILEHVAKGLSNREIGEALGFSDKTVKHYMTNILEKLHVRNRVEAALLVQKDKQVNRAV